MSMKGDCMRLVFVFVLGAALLVTACAQPTADNDVYDDIPPDLPPTPPPPGPAVVETVDDDTEIIEDPSEVLAGDKIRDTVGGIVDIQCDLATETLTFTIVNEAEENWQLNQEVGFTPPEGLVSAAVFVNNYEVNRGTPQYKGGKPLFGPNDQFSDNCGGVEELAPGARATCTLTPVPLHAENDYSPKNRIWLDVYGDIDYVSFICN